jgi:hypothetical protein
MNLEKRLKELGLKSYGSQAITLKLEYGWIAKDFYDPKTSEYVPTVTLYLWLENGQLVTIEDCSIEKVLDRAEERLSDYRQAKELGELRTKLEKIHTLSTCTT